MLIAKSYADRKFRAGFDYRIEMEITIGGSG